MAAVAIVLWTGLFHCLAALRSGISQRVLFAERLLVANVIAETCSFDSWAVHVPVRPYRRQMLRICAEGRLTPQA
jgi:hypothetical protein